MAMEVFTISGAAFGTPYDSSGRSAQRQQAAGSAAISAATPAIRLQNALSALGAARGDGALNVSIDGVIGPGTVKAVNYALKNVIGAGPVRGLGGRFLNATATKADVQNYAAALAQIFTQAVINAGGSVPPPPVISRSSGASSAMKMKAEAAIQDNSGTSSAHPYLVWIVGGAAILVAFIGFTAAKRRANA